MTKVSYEVRLQLNLDHLEVAKESIEKLFGIWEENVDPEEMTMLFDEQTGEVLFDTKGEHDVSPWITDDTPLLLHQLGKLSLSGAYVHHTMDGKTLHFAVGPNKLARQQALEMAHIRKAIYSLNEAVEYLPDEYKPQVEELVTTLRNLYK
ncbi:hypothetical protein [Desulfoplanes formicivorans]|uniref:Uncharacterized protein n=1 Tax=Desulfoplanes formicivorans TaxID=1592317 RepID=A0A194AD99_9BACT|nr:hypothetical protein [Desulfoplanes formicivorans]GAU08067.1 hypothetical protein DPF_0768 [Desulfoplanes formicivorans]